MKGKLLNRTLAALFSVMLIVGLLPTTAMADSGGLQTVGELPVGSKIIMGSTTPSADTGETLYSETNDNLSWIIVDQSDSYGNGGTTLLSEFTLKRMEFSGNDDTNYRTSDVRKWLQDVFPSCFSSEEMQYVLDTSYDCSYSPGGLKVEKLSDKFFLLSLTEVGCNETTDPYNWNHIRTEGVKLAYFDDTQQKSETRATRGINGQIGDWWLRSQYATYGYQNSGVDIENGSLDSIIAPGYDETVRPAFNIGKNTVVKECETQPGYYEIYYPILDSISLNQAEVTMAVDETTDLKLTFNGKNGTQVPIEEQEVNWTSSNPDVVTVDSNGKITAIKEGVSDITVTTKIGQKTAACKVTVMHTHSVVKTEAKPATHMTEGNIEYWYCDGCDKYFSNEAGTKEIALADTVIPKLTEHTADGTGWYSDETNHWNKCECGEKLNEAAHTFEWVIDKEATAAEVGSKHEECTVCGYQKEAVEIPAAGTGTSSQPGSSQNGSGGSASGNVQTGEYSSLTFWIALLTIAFGGIMAAVSSKKFVRRS